MIVINWQKLLHFFSPQRRWTERGKFSTALTASNSISTTCIIMHTHLWILEKSERKKNKTMAIKRNINLHRHTARTYCESRRRNMFRVIWKLDFEDIFSVRCHVLNVLTRKIGFHISSPFKYWKCMHACTPASIFYFFFSFTFSSNQFPFNVLNTYLWMIISNNVLQEMYVVEAKGDGLKKNLHSMQERISRSGHVFLIFTAHLLHRFLLNFMQVY